MTDPQKPEITRPSLDEMYGSLNWFDEEAISKAFGIDIHDMMQAFAEETASLGTVVVMVRAFDFIRAIRDGAKEHEALKAVRMLTAEQISDISTAYLDHEDEAMPDEPDTEAGKDDSLSDEPTSSSQPSA